MGKISKILIANRGEIACRVMETAQRLEIATVAVYSDSDRNARHVRMADEAVHIGPSPTAESYLVIEKIVQACRDTGADAVHPGYGFLSENPAFARALKKAGITFIGPAPESMEAMGLKDAAKALMADAGVPITPGYHGDNQDPAFLKKQAAEIGYPVLIKAVAGGGGKGMRKVDAAKDFDDALLSCQREAKSSFADDRVLIEKYINSPRHIEVQVFGDIHGNVVHFFERDCSLQRRHQKVIEEAPAPGMTQDVRAAMTEAAVKAAQAVDYVGAGTVEFIVDGSGPLRSDGFWFMEMNTRLQVEHPVTEMITGMNLVELQIRVAEGGRLPHQGDITMGGHALEARLYAEDPANDFLPSVGPLDILVLPGLHRVDTGVEQGGEVSLYYDPMIAKLIVHSSDRTSAIRELAHMCRVTQVYPIRTNARFLHRCLSHPAFIAGDVSTNFIEAKGDALFVEGLSAEDLNAVALALEPESTDSLFGHPDGWRLNQPTRTHYIRHHDGEELALALLPHDNAGSRFQEVRRPEGRIVFVDGEYFLTTNASGAVGAMGGGNSVVAPMPGKIIALHVAEGDNVQAGDKVITMEAMKMEMALEAPRDGTIDKINITADALVNDGEILLELED